MGKKSRAPGRSGDSSAREMPAVKTTIVGGRPPGCGKLLGAIPRGIEVLLKKSAVDPKFRTRLLEERAGAASAIGLRLEPAEGEILNGIERGQLESVIRSTRVDPGVRPAFLGQAAAVMLVALGASTAGCNRSSTPESSGEATAPTEESVVVSPPAEAPPPVPAATEGTPRSVGVAGVVVGEPIEVAVPKAPAEVQVVTGIVLEKTQLTAPAEVQVVAGVVVKAPVEVHVVDGIRIDRPAPVAPTEVQIVKGIRAVAPEKKTPEEEAPEKKAPETKTPEVKPPPPPPEDKSKVVRPAEIQVMRGVRIDRPKKEPQAVLGIRPLPQPKPEDK